MRLVSNTNSFEKETKVLPIMETKATNEDLFLQLQQLSQRVKQLEIDLAWATKSAGQSANVN